MDGGAFDAALAPGDGKGKERVLRGRRETSRAAFSVVLAGPAGQLEEGGKRL